MKIHKLDSIVSSRIAAGEVVERPSSIVRELIDNSIDAGSTKITINIIDGGIKEITIKDNGSGIEKEDLSLAFTRHATSKISTIDDLFTLKTLGFRGEALSSIASVSTVTISSKGNKLTVNNGIEEDILPSSITEGTLISVKSLFEKVPARLQFLKRPSSEYTECKKIFIEKALGFENVDFTLLKNDTLDLHFSPLSKKDRILEVLSFDRHFITTEIMEMSYTEDGLGLYALSGKPSQYKRDRSGITVFVNNKITDSYATVKIISNAYSAALPGGVYPYFYLFIEENTELVDFNIHPTKRECKLRRQAFIFSAITKMIRESLIKESRNAYTGANYSNNGLKQTETDFAEENNTFQNLFDKFANASDTPYSGNISYEKPPLLNESERKTNYSENSYMNYTEIGNKSNVFNDSVLSYSKSNSNNNSPNVKNYSQNNKKYESDGFSKPYAIKNEETNFSADWLDKAKKLLSKTESKKTNDISDSSESNSIPHNTDNNVKTTEDSSDKTDNIDSESQKIEKNVSFRYVGQVFNTFLLAEIEGDLLFIDQHAAHERILYNEIIENPMAQGLAIPYKFETERSVDEYLLKNSFVYADLGVTLVRSEPMVWEIYTVPAWCNKEESEIAHFISNYTGDLEEARKGLFAVIACRSAIKAGENLDAITAKNLLEKVFKLEELVCPHGRSFVYSITKDELFKKVGRIL